MNDLSVAQRLGGPKVGPTNDHKAPSSPSETSGFSHGHSSNGPRSKCFFLCLSLLLASMIQALVGRKARSVMVCVCV